MHAHLPEFYEHTRQWPFAVVVVNQDDDVLEVLAVSINAGIAGAAFEAALTRRNQARIQLRNGGRIMRTEEAVAIDPYR